MKVDRITHSRDVVIWNFRDAKFHDFINNEHLNLDIPHRRTVCKNISLFRQELPEKKHFEDADRQIDIQKNDRTTNPQTDTSTDNKGRYIAERSRINTCECMFSRRDLV